MRFFFVVLALLLSAILPAPVANASDLGAYIITCYVDKATDFASQPFFFVQKENQPIAAKVLTWNSSYSPKLGDKVTIIGDLSSGSRRIITNAAVTFICANNSLPKPIAVNNKALHSALNGKGAPIYGLRVRIWGNVMSPYSSEDIEISNGWRAAYIDDGSGINWPNPLPHQHGVRLLTSSWTTLDTINTSAYYISTGVIDSDIQNGRNLPQIWLDE